MPKPLWLILLLECDSTEAAADPAAGVEREVLRVVSSDFATADVDVEADIRPAEVGAPVTAGDVRVTGDVGEPVVSAPLTANCGLFK